MLLPDDTLVCFLKSNTLILRKIWGVANLPDHKHLTN